MHAAKYLVESENHLDVVFCCFCFVVVVVVVVVIVVVVNPLSPPSGANSGIGLEAAKYLVEGGNHVIFGCRNEQKANEVIEKIKRDNPRGQATFLQVSAWSRMA